METSDKAYLDGDFKEIYYKHYPVATRVAYYILKDKDVAEDIAQDVFIKLWEKKDRIADVENLKSYVAQMSRNSALDHIKSSAKIETESLELQVRPEFADETHVQNDHDIKSKIEKAVGMLSPKCRLVFSLSRFEGLTNDEIAEYLEISKRTVETQISQALKLFRTDLKHIFAEYLTTIPFFVLSYILL